MDIHQLRDLSASYRHGQMRDCAYGCYSVTSPDVRATSQMQNPIMHHWEMAPPGYKYYYCIVHHAYHCIFSICPIDQPCCGECAPAYYNGVHEAAWIRVGDYHKVLYRVPPAFTLLMSDKGQAAPRGSSSGGEQQASSSSSDEQQVSSPSGGEQSGSSSAVEQPAPPSPPRVLRTIFPFPREDDDLPALECIPRQDVTYRELATVMMGHRRQHGLILMRFTDYDGLPSWMLVGTGMSQNSFSHLAEVEKHGDQRFIDSRLWACQNLGVNLPQDIRWVLWSVYMLCSKALANPVPTEQENRMWLSWLLYWVGKLEELCEVYQFRVSTPDFAKASHDEGGASAVPNDSHMELDQVKPMDQPFSANEETSNENNAAQDASHFLSAPGNNLTFSATANQGSSFQMTGVSLSLASIKEDEDIEADAKKQMLADHGATSSV